MKSLVVDGKSWDGMAGNSTGYVTELRHMPYDQILITPYAQYVATILNDKF